MANCGRPDHQIEIAYQVARGSQTAALLRKYTASFGINRHKAKTHKKVL